MKLRDYQTLWQLAHKRLESENNYREFQSFQASLLIEYLAENDVRLDGRLCLDLGGGTGGYSQEFTRHGARVIFMDLAQPHTLTNSSIAQVRGNALWIPLLDETIDFVFCASLIEHVAQPERLLAEIERVMKPSGMSYISFPPYYSPNGGHEFSPFHYFGERIAIRLVNRQMPEWARDLFGATERQSGFSGLFADWGLYKMTLRKFRALVKYTRLRNVSTSTRYLSFSFVRWPLLGEVLTWHAQFLLVKPSQFGSDL